MIQIFLKQIKVKRKCKQIEPIESAKDSIKLKLSNIGNFIYNKQNKKLSHII